MFKYALASGNFPPGVLTVITDTNYPFRARSLILYITDKDKHMYSYSWHHWLTFFYIYCFLGWIFESSYVSLKERHFVNRGFLRLPMLPLYGTGAIMLLWVSLPFRSFLPLIFLSGVIAATMLEYTTGFLMEQLFQVKYWDYSNKKWNIHGYICLSSSIAWGFLTIFMTEVIHKPIESAVLGLPASMEFSFLFLLSSLFVADIIHSTKEALDLAKALKSIAMIRAELEELQVQIALLKAETAQNFREKRDETLLRAEEKKDETLRKVSERLQSLTQKQEQLINHIGTHWRKLVQRNPGATSKKFTDILRDIRHLHDLDKKR